jgi:hypothetical protein
MTGLSESLKMGLILGHIVSWMGGLIFPLDGALEYQ